MSTPTPSPAERCGIEFYGLLCSRDPGHDGQHIHHAARPPVATTTTPMVDPYKLTAGGVGSGEPTEPPCGATHPSNHTVVPCILSPGHPGQHYSSTGCIGSGIDWADEEPTEEASSALTILTAARLASLSRWIDEAPANAARDPEAALWGRVAKVGEEHGEVIAALVGATGQNPRKGVTHTMDDVVEELLDTALTALCAVEHMTENRGFATEMLARKVARVHARAGLAVDHV